MTWCFFTPNYIFRHYACDANPMLPTIPPVLWAFSKTGGCILRCSVSRKAHGVFQTGSSKLRRLHTTLKSIFTLSSVALATCRLYFAHKPPPPPGSALFANEKVLRRANEAFCWNWVQPHRQQQLCRFGVETDFGKLIESLPNHLKCNDVWGRGATPSWHRKKQSGGPLLFRKTIRIIDRDLSGCTAQLRKRGYSRTIFAICCEVGGFNSLADPQAKGHASPRARSEINHRRTEME